VAGKANSASKAAARAMRFLPRLPTRLIEIVSVLIEFCFICRELTGFLTATPLWR